MSWATLKSEGWSRISTSLPQELGRLSQFRRTTKDKDIISTNKEELYIELAGTFNIKNINTNKIKGKIDINTKIDLNFKNNKYIFPKLGIVYWQ